MEGSQALERREQTAGGIVKAVPIPALLQELGVRIGKDEGSGMAIVVIPKEVKAKLNVISPVTSIAQADPNWTPAISIVELDKELHSYSVAGKRGLNKQALETLANAAGVLYTRTERVPRDQLQDGELWAYKATVGFRRSDGQITHVTRERGFVAEVERDEIEQAVRKTKVYQGEALKFTTPEAIEAEVKKRWINELRFGPSKTESKAINRALRAGLQVPTSLPPAAFSKPFLVIGYNFTPDYDDAETKALLIRAGLNAETAVYGTSRALEPGAPVEDDVVEEGEATPVSDTAPEEGLEEEAREQAGDDGNSTETVEASSVVAGSSSDAEPVIEGKGAIKIPDAVIDAAGPFVTSSVPRGDTKGLTVAELTGGDEAHHAWVLWALRNLEEGEERSALETFVQHRAPELWALHLESQAGE